MHSGKKKKFFKSFLITWDTGFSSMTVIVKLICYTAYTDLIVTGAQIKEIESNDFFYVKN